MLKRSARLGTVTRLWMNGMIALVFAGFACLYGQGPETEIKQQTPLGQSLPGQLHVAEPEVHPPAPNDPSYILGPGDQITLWGVDYAAEIADRPVRIDASGYVNLPLAGQVYATGRTLQQFEAEVVSRLKTYIQNPQIAATVTDFRSQRVSIIGAVRQPGVHYLQGRQTLVEILSLAGGLLPEASHKIKITRRSEWGDIPVGNVVEGPNGEYVIAEIDLNEITAAGDPTRNITVKPHDVISVPRASLIYVVGAVTRSGGFVLNNRESMSVLEALSMAGGLLQFAAAKKAKILRLKPGTSERVEVAVNLKGILNGRAADDVLHPDDILFVPDRAGKRAATAKTIDTAIHMGSLAIWRF